MVKKKTLFPILNSQKVLKIGADKSFTKTFKKIYKSKKCDVVWVQSPKTHQMAAVLSLKLFGQKFLWIQGFSNPPIPSIFSRILLNQADIVTLKSKKLAGKLRSLGIEKPKIKIIKDN